MAADAFSQAIQVKPEFVEAYNARSIVNHELGKFTEAIHDCERALKINPKYKESVFNLARSQQSLNQCDRAIQNYTKAISLDRNYLKAFLGRAESWKSKKRYQLDVHRVRYEDLVVDFKSEVSSVLSFLSLSWEDKLLNYQRTAQTRKKIFTPSYSQVIKPIYNSASYRWTHYEGHLEDFKPLVQPWIDEYGY